MQRPPPVVPALQDLGIYLDRVMAPQPLGPSGPMAQGHLTITETQDVDLILSQAPKTNMHEVPSCLIFRANNTTLEFPCESIASGKSPTYQPTTNPPGLIAKQVAYPSDSSSRREPNVRTLWPDNTRLMVSPTKLIVHFSKAEPISQSASPSHLKSEKSEDDLRLFGKFCPQSYMNSEKEMIQALSFSLHSTFNHKFSVLRIAGVACENQCSNLLHLETDSCFLLLLLICVFLVFLMMCCNRSSLKPAIWLRIARPMCDGRPFASPLFRRLAGRGPFFGLYNLRSLWFDA